MVQLPKIPPWWDDGLAPLNGKAPGQPASLTIDQVDPDGLIRGRPEGNYIPWAGPKNPIGPVKGYPENGRDAWRMANDDVIVAAAAKYNSENGFLPGDPLYIAP